MPEYIALMRKERKSDYSVDFPDFPGCVTAGKTLDEARKMAAEALQGHIEVMLEYGEPVPEASSPEKIMSDPDNADAVAFLVSVHAKKPKAKRINITFPEDILEKVDRYVGEHPRLNRSQFLVRSAEQALQEFTEKESLRVKGKRSVRKTKRSSGKKRKAIA